MSSFLAALTFIWRWKVVPPIHRPRLSLDASRGAQPPAARRAKIRPPARPEPGRKPRNRSLRLLAVQKIRLPATREPMGTSGTANGPPASREPSQTESWARVAESQPPAARRAKNPPARQAEPGRKPRGPQPPAARRAKIRPPARLSLDASRGVAAPGCSPGKDPPARHTRAQAEPGRKPRGRSPRLLAGQRSARPATREPTDTSGTANGPPASRGFSRAGLRPRAISSEAARSAFAASQISGAAKSADTTATPAAPLPASSGRFCSVTPPFATTGIETVRQMRCSVSTSWRRHPSWWRSQTRRRSPDNQRPHAPPPRLPPPCEPSRR